MTRHSTPAAFVTAVSIRDLTLDNDNAPAAAAARQQPETRRKARFFSDNPGWSHLIPAVQSHLSSNTGLAVHFCQ